MLESTPRKEPFITHSCRGLSVGIETESYNPRERIMKKVLLTTTALVMTAGVAAAEISFSGTTQVGASSTAGANYALNTGIDFNVAVSAATDNGITVSTGFDTGFGSLIDYNDDDKVEGQSALSNADAVELTIGYAGYTFSADPNGVDNLYNGDLPGADLGISGSLGGITFAVTGDMEDNNSSYKAAYTMGDVTATLTGTNDENGTAVAGSDAAMALALSYKMGDLTLTASTDDEGAADSTNKIGFSYVMDSITVSYTTIDPSAAGKSMGAEWDASIKYSAGALTASYAIDEASATTLIAEYDLGGGATFFAAAHEKAGTANDFNAMGINFAF